MLLDGRQLVTRKICGNRGTSARLARRSIRKFSMTVLASNLRHISSMSESLVPSARSSSISLPARTSLTPEKPSPSSAWWIALPCGSRTPGLRVMNTRAFMDRLRSYGCAAACGIARYGDWPCGGGHGRRIDCMSRRLRRQLFRQTRAAQLALSSWHSAAQASEPHAACAPDASRERCRRRPARFRRGGTATC